MEKIALIVEDRITHRKGTLVSTYSNRCAVAWSDGSIANAQPDTFDTIGEISYTGVPHDRICAHASCQRPIAIYFNVRNEKWYCSACSRILNSGGKIVCFPVED